MKDETKQKINNCFKEQTGRDPKPNEKINAQKDVGLVMPIILQKVEDLEDRIEKLEKFLIL